MKLLLMFALAFYFINSRATEIGDESCDRPDIKNFKQQFMEFLKKMFGQQPTSFNNYNKYSYLMGRCAAHLDEGVQLMKQIKKDQIECLRGEHVTYYYRYLCSEDKEFFTDHYPDNLFEGFLQDCLIPSIGGFLTRRLFNTSDSEISIYERADFCSVDLTDDLLSEVLSSGFEAECNTNDLTRHLKGMMKFGKENKYCGYEHPMHCMIYFNELQIKTSIDYDY